MTESDLMHLVDKNARAITKREYPDYQEQDYEWRIPAIIRSNIRQVAASHARKGEDLTA